MGDLGGYGIAELPPAGPLFARGPYRALGQKGNPWEVVRNSISTHVTHAEITHFVSHTSEFLTIFKAAFFAMICGPTV